jgi:hypothetical protein
MLLQTMIRIPRFLYSIASKRARLMANKLLHQFDPFNAAKELHLKSIKLGLLGEEIIKHVYEQAGWYVKYGDGLHVDLLYRHIKVSKDAWYVWVYVDISESYYTILGCLPWHIVDNMPIEEADNEPKKIIIPTYRLYQFIY